MMMTILVNHVRVLVWQNTKDGQKGRNTPEPLLLPEQSIEKQKTHAKNYEKAHALRERLRRRAEREAGE